MVVSSGMDKTIVVRVDAVKAHKKYQKVVRRSTKFHAHDEENQAKVGDVVRIVETRPLSKTKNWRLRKSRSLNDATYRACRPAGAQGAASPRPSRSTMRT